MPRLTLLLAVPTDVTLLILSFLSPATLTTCAAVSPTLKPLSLHDLLWAQLLSKHPVQPQPVPSVSAPSLTSTSADTSSLSSSSASSASSSSSSRCSSPPPPSSYVQYMGRSLDALRTWITVEELQRLRWRFAFHSVQFSLVASLTPTFNETHVHAPPFGSYPYALYDRERGSDDAAGERGEGLEDEELLDVDGLPLSAPPARGSAQSAPVPPSAYERRGFLSPALRAECERLWSEHDGSALHHAAARSAPLSERSALFARCALPFTALHLVDMFCSRSLAFQHLPLFTSGRTASGGWRLTNQLGTFTAPERTMDGVADGENGGNRADEAQRPQAEAEGIAGEELLAFGEDWLGELNDEQW